MIKRLLLIATFFAILFVANGQSEYQTNYYDLVKQVRSLTKQASQPVKGSKTEFREEIFDVVKLAHRLQEEALTEALDNSADEKVLSDIGFACMICDALLKAIDLKVKYNSKKYDTYIEKLKSAELAITLQIKSQEKH
jgi:predicted aconitase